MQNAFTLHYENTGALVFDERPVHRLTSNTIWPHATEKK